MVSFVERSTIILCPYFGGSTVYIVHVRHTQRECMILECTHLMDRHVHVHVYNMYVYKKGLVTCMLPCRCLMFHKILYETQLSIIIVFNNWPLSKDFCFLN